MIENSRNNRLSKLFGISGVLAAFIARVMIALVMEERCNQTKWV